MASIAVDLNKDYLLVSFDATNVAVNGPKAYPFAWLRDNCQCAECCHPFTKERLFLLRYLDADIQPSSYKCEGDDVVVTWPDGHVSPYPRAWLLQHSFEPQNAKLHEQSVELTEELWESADMQGRLQRFDFQQMMSDDQVLLGWLVALEKQGIALIVNTPLEGGVVKQVCQRVGVAKMTQYGETFKIMVKPNPSNIAYTAKTLGLHTDLPSLTYQPGMQMLHCIKQVEADGGDNSFADGFKVANDLKRQDPESFKLLNETMVSYKDEGSDFLNFDIKAMKPILQCGRNGAVNVVTYNNQMRDPVCSVPLECMKPLYRALTTYERMLNSPKYRLQYKMADGEVACFHNYRVLHGREGYEYSNGERYLEGGYIDWDFLRSKRRVLQTQQNKEI